MKKYIYLLVVIIIVSGFFIASNRSQESTITLGDQQSSSTKITFTKPKKSAHYESNVPAHGSILAASPVNIVIDFNFDLSSNSSISITDIKGVEYGIGDNSIDDNKLALRKLMSTTSPDGIYTVNYNACWPDRSCHKGYFQFAIDKSLVENYSDLRNKSEIVINMSDIAFKPDQVKVSPGTRVTWVNDEDATHYINTDSHPGHTYYPAQNSKALAKGEKFSLIFDKVGVYPYHCSAHAGNMIGSIIVE